MSGEKRPIGVRQLDGTFRGDGAQMAKLTIGILEAGTNRAEFVPNHGTYVDWFRRFFGDGPTGGFAYRAFAAYDGHIPESLAACDAYVITGSVHSLTEPKPWMRRLQDFVLRAAVDRPVLGICFGHQLIADALGGRVERVGWGIGAHRYRVHRPRPWMRPARPNFSILASHSDQVTDPPPNAEVLAGNAFCPIGMMQIGSTIMTLQNHPEMTKDFVADLYQVRKELIGAEDVAAALASLNEETDEALIRGWLRQFLTQSALAPAD